jgi:hypothetical protein
MSDAPTRVCQRPGCSNPITSTRPDAKYCKRACQQRRHIPVTADAPAPELEAAPPPSTLFDEHWDTLCQWIGRTPVLAHAVPPPATSQDILHLCDLHIPHLNERAFARAINENRDCQTVVLGGDALNCAAASRFIEAEFAHPKDEIAQLTMVLQLLSETFEEVVCGLGNHVDRIRKYFGSRIPPYMMFLVETNPVQYVIEGLRKERGLTNLRIAQPVMAGLDTGRWLTLVGDVAFTHAETHSKLKMRPAENVAHWLRKWQRHLPTWPRIVCQEHNHTGGKVYDDDLGAWLIQTPCLSENVNYQVESRIAYGPNQIGYTRIHRDAAGRSDGNASTFVLFDVDDNQREAA